MSAASRSTRSSQKTGAAADIRPALLLAALPDVAFDGWHENLLADAARRAGIDTEAAEDAFPDGTRGLALYFSEWADEEMRKKLAREKLADMRVRDRVARGVEIRLEILTPWKAAVSSALSYLGTPPGGLLLPAHVWRTADIIWQAAGDTATDYNRYTKRFLLSGVITATILYWLGDDSEDHADTRTFLARRIDNVMKVGKASGTAGGKIKSTIKNVLGGLRGKKNA